LCEDDEAHVRRGFVRWCVDFERDRPLAEILDLSNALERSYDADMFEMLTAIFAGFYLGGGAGIDEGSVKVAVGESGTGGRRDGAGDTFAIDCGLG
jgi:hypothetical protein